ncbi:Ribosomal protein S6 kinase, partial [Operophtera brumata]
MAASEMSVPDKKPEHESGYYEGSDEEEAVECGCGSPASSRHSSHSVMLKRRHHSHTKPKKLPPKKPRMEPLMDEHLMNTISNIDKSVEIVECVPVDYSYRNHIDHLSSEAGPSTNMRSTSSVELIGGTVPAPARDSVDWSLVEASKIRKRYK